MPTPTSELDVKFFRRTSTHEILDVIFSGKSTFEQIKQAMQERGHKRKDHDIRYMIKTLERVGLVDNGIMTEFGEKVRSFSGEAIKFSQEMQNSSNQEKLAVPGLVRIAGKEILKEFYRRGFLLSPFLEAIQQEANNQIISARFFQATNKAGFYNLNAETDWNDFVPSMKNFAVYLGLAERTEKRGEVRLSPISEAILQLDSGYITERKQCKEELCRKVCPAGAIYTEYVTGCINCGLCARCCPYGAATCSSADSRVRFDFTICSSSPTQKQTRTCQMQPNLDEMIGSEKTMQNWIVNLFRICHFEAIIPGPGLKPDIVLNRKEGSTIFECKNEAVRGKKIEDIQEQLETYMQQDLIQKMKLELQDIWKFTMKEPDLFFISAPEKTDLAKIMGDIANTLKFPLSFISTNALFELHKAILKRKKIDTNSILDTFAIKNQDISKDITQILSNTT